MQDHFDEFAAQWGLKFAPDRPPRIKRISAVASVTTPPVRTRSAYGITDAYTEELKVVLVDGSLIHTREVVLDSEEYEAIVAKDDRESAIHETVRGISRNTKARSRRGIRSSNGTSRDST